MADILSSLFGSKVQYQNAQTVDPLKASQQAAGFNWGQIGQFEQNAPGMTQFMQQLFNQTSPQVQQSLNTNFGLGTQLATQGYSNAQKGALDYYRQLGLQTAGATGAPVSSQYAQNFGGNFGAQQILQNQLQGSQILGQNANQQSTLTQSFLQPSLNILQNNLTNPGQFINAGLANSQMQNQQNNLQSQSSAGASPFGSFVTSLLASVGGQASGMGLQDAFRNSTPYLLPV